MKERFSVFLSVGLLILFFSGCRPAENIERPADQPAATKEEMAAVRVSAEKTDAGEPAMAADADGNIYVVYVEHETGAADVYLQKFDPKIVPVGERVRVNPEKGRAKAWYGDPPTIRIGSDKTVFIGWTAPVKGAERSSATDLFLSVSHDGGRTFDQPVKVNDDNVPASHGMHSLEIGQNNRVLMAWLDERNVRTGHQAKNTGNPQKSEPEFGFIKVFHDSHKKAGDESTGHQPVEKLKENSKSEPEEEMSEPNSEVFWAVSADGGKTFSANRRLASEVCPCCKTALASAPDGRIYLSWRQVLPGDFRHIAVASSADGGENFTAPVIVSDDQWQLNACPVSGASLFIDPDNSVEVVWFSAGKTGASGLQTARSTDGGKTFSPRRTLFDGMIKSVSDISAAGGVKHAFFETDGRLYEAVLETGREDPVTREIGAGEMPATVSFNAHSFISFIKKEDDKRTVWLMKI